MTTPDNRPRRPRPQPAPSSLASTPDHAYAQMAGHSSVGEMRRAAVRWAKRGRWLDLVCALASYGTYLVMGGRFWLVSAVFCAIMWAVDLWLYRKLTRTAQPN